MTSPTKHKADATASPAGSAADKAADLTGADASTQAAHKAKSARATDGEESQLDDAVENTFPASDPVAEVPASAASIKVIDSEDALLDEGIEETFPASDPVAVSNITKIIPAPDQAGGVEAGAKSGAKAGTKSDPKDPAAHTASRTATKP